METSRTCSGIPFGIIRAKGPPPTPVLFVFALGIEDTLCSPAYNRVGDVLWEQGFACVSLDMPCHGADRRSEEPDGLDGWRSRIEAGEDLIGSFAARSSAVLDRLIEQEQVDPRRVAAWGVSRGGFMALHWAARDRRIGCAAAVAPVTDLLALAEFEGAPKRDAVESLALVHRADDLANRAIWVCIGNNDKRVDTDSAIRFARAVAISASSRGLEPSVDLHVVRGAEHRLGHLAHLGAQQEAAEWIGSQLNWLGSASSHHSQEQ